MELVGRVGWCGLRNSPRPSVTTMSDQIKDRVDRDEACRASLHSPVIEAPTMNPGIL